MRVTVLGSGTCASHLPGIPNRFPPGFLVEWGKEYAEKMLFDCSEGVRFRLEEVGVDFSTLGHIAISHAHPDHYALVHFLQAAFCKNMWTTEPLPQDHEVRVYCPTHIAQDFPQLLALYNPDMEGKFWPWPQVAFQPMSARNEELAIGTDAKLTTADVHHGHGKIEALAFRLETRDGIFAYSGDTGDCEGIRRISQGADIFVCESSANIADTDMPFTYGHLTPHAAGAIAHGSHAKKLVLTHYKGLDSDEAMMEDCKRSGYQGEIVIAKDFLKITR